MFIKALLTSLWCRFVRRIGIGRHLIEQRPGVIWNCVSRQMQCTYESCWWQSVYCAVI